VPFTLSHAVVALPFVRTPLVPAAIAVGAMTPDLPLFVRTGIPTYGFTHSLVALPVTVVVAFVLLLVWRCVLRPAAAELSPRWLAERLPRTWGRGPRGALRETLGGTRPSASALGLLALSLALGVVSHIVWDLFTHEGRGGVDLLPILAAQWGPLPGYKWAQHGSSALGLVILGVWAAVWLRRRRPATLDRATPPVVRWVWWVSLPATLLAAWLVGMAMYGPLTTEWTAQHLAYRVLPVAVAGWGAATLVLALAVTATRVTRANAAKSATKRDAG
jgi:membrane-bound metal-dependent hydrolase YbcI (DUF457 family)